MRILIVSCSFPPENVIGAVRVGKLAKYLHQRDYEICVLAAPPTGDTSLPLEIPTDRVIHAKDWNIDGLFDPLVAFLRRCFGRTPAQPHERVTVDKPSSATGLSSATAAGTSLKERIRWHYYALLRIPDARAGWLKNATSAGCELVARWRPDIIFASAPPVTSLFVAAALGKRFGIPWVAELRDLWVENPYYPFPRWRRLIDRLLEKRVLNQAAMLVTVTPPWGRALQARFEKPVSVILNGYAREDCPVGQVSAPKTIGPLSITYTGNIYRGFRDPSALFAAITKLAPQERRSLRVDFYGPSVGAVQSLVSNYDVGDCVRIHGLVNYLESLEIQRNSDILLLLQWNDPRDAGNIPAKFFEYMAAGRPILFLGYEQGTLAELIRDRNAGLVSNDVGRIAAQLSSWVKDRQRGPIAALPASAKVGLSREDQFQELESLLMKLVPGR